MIILNILLDKLDFNESWAYDTLKNIIKPEYKVCIIPFAFHDDWIKNKVAWDECYNKSYGKYYKEMMIPFYDYGINDNNVELINYFEDSTDNAKKKINNSNIILFTGGFPEKIMKRLIELDLVSIVENYKGIIMGWSAGAMMQCHDYYISPDEKDYFKFVYEKGLDFIRNFAVEVHYKNSNIQNESIEKYINETGKNVYTTETKSAIIVDNDEVILLGNAKQYKLK